MTDAEFNAAISVFEAQAARFRRRLAVAAAVSLTLALIGLSVFAVVSALS
jgi:hypothetical protein